MSVLAGVVTSISGKEDGGQHPSGQITIRNALVFCCSAASLSFSMPTSDIAIFLNKLLTLWPAFADVSMNIMFNSVALELASSKVTCLWKIFGCQ